MSDSPLTTLLSRQPIAGTRGYLVDNQNQVIVAAGEGVRNSVPQVLVRRALAGPVLSSDGFVMAAAPVPGTSWTYVLEAPETSVLAPMSGSRTEWIGLGVVGLIGLAVVLFATRVMAARERTRQEKAIADEQLRLTVQHAPIGMAMLDLDQRFVEPNAKLCEMLGHSTAELEKLTWGDVTHPDDLGLDDGLVVELLAGATGHYEIVKRLMTADGGVIEGRSSVALVRDEHDDPQHYVAQIEDVTSIRAAERELRRRAHYDSLTDLPNRELLLQRLDDALEGERGESLLAVGFCDLDEFKHVNDTDGHQVGDLVLREVARRLTAVVREGDTVGRMGGDEFVLMLRDLRSREEAEHILERARQAVEVPIVLHGRQHRVGLSTGLAFADPGDSADRLLGNADLALYAAKRGGRNRVEVYTPAMRPDEAAEEPRGDAERRKVAATPSGADTGAGGVVAIASPVPAPAAEGSMEQCIRDALEHDRVTLAYQPVIDLTSGLLVGVEALLRLKDADGVTVAPFEVIGVAEQSGLIIDLGWRVLQLATIQGGAWRDEYDVIVPVAVNVSAVQLGSAGFLADVLASVARAGLPPHALTLELTESVMLAGASPGSQQLHELRDAGFELAIDDFGTGYASLSYLHELPAATLKIDQTFVAGVPEDRRAVAIIAGVVALARHCGIACIAEGIENEEQRAHLAQLGVLGQGYLLGRPGTADAIGALIRAGMTDLPGGGLASAGEASAANTRDPVTGALWRDPGMKELDREVVRARRSAASLVLAFVRIEFATPVDPRSAHLVLVEVAVAVQNRLRAYDLVVRYGDEELMCAVVGTPIEAIDARLVAVAEELNDLEGHPTVRVGLAEMMPGESLESLVARVDAGAEPVGSPRG